MKKDKRGIALITAIAVLALMLILFGGLAMVYSSQVSRNKAELEESQAMLVAQSYAEMLNQVLTSTVNEADGLKEKLGEISTGREVEIESRLDNQPDDVIDSQVKITAIAEKAKTNGNTTTRKIKIKVAATVNDETRSIDLDYTFKKVTGGVMDYAVYGNTVDYYEDGDDYEDDDDENEDAQSVVFNNDWYYIYNDPKHPSAKEEKLVDDPDIFTKEKTYKYGYADTNGKVFKIEKDGIIQSPDGNYDAFGIGINKNDSSAVLPDWTGIPDPQELEGLEECTAQITTSCIWDENLYNGVFVNAVDEDIVIYMPIDNDYVLDRLAIFFDSAKGMDGKRKQLYIYMYSTSSKGKIKLGENLKVANMEDNRRSNYLDIFVVCNDEIEVELSSISNEQNILEAYFYFSKGTVLWETQTSKQNYYNRIRGCLIADKIVILGDEKRNFNQVGVEYVPPKDIEGSGSSKATITYILNSYEEGGRS